MKTIILSVFLATSNKTGSKIKLPILGDQVTITRLYKARYTITRNFPYISPINDKLLTMPEPIVKLYQH